MAVDARSVAPAAELLQGDHPETDGLATHQVGQRLTGGAQEGLVLPVQGHGPPGRVHGPVAAPGQPAHPGGQPAQTQGQGLARLTVPPGLAPQTQFRQAGGRGRAMDSADGQKGRQQPQGQAAHRCQALRLMRFIAIFVA